jgi:lysyl-tRNA synthetase class 2
VTPSFRPFSHHKNLENRAKILGAIRAFFNENGFLEMETPHRIPVPIPEAHIDLTVSGPWVLHPSPELCMKRMLARGFDRIYQICRCWRDGERGSHHLPEFTMLEWYRTHADYTAIMADCEALLRASARAVGSGAVIRRGDRTIDLNRPWERLSVREAFFRYGGISMEEALEKDLFDEIMVCGIEPELGMERPTILMEYPAERGSLAKKKVGEENIAERFELYIGGLELTNAFSELVDVEEQRKRFIRERTLREAAGKTAYPLPENFLKDLSRVPPSAGIALGVDRLVMLLLEAETIDEVVALTPEEL